jgi:hypothetical protein
MVLSASKTAKALWLALRAIILLRLLAAAEGQDLRELWMWDADEKDDAFAAVNSDKVVIRETEVFIIK